MSAALPPDAERFLVAFEQLATHEWLRAARVYAGARQSLMLAEARASLLTALRAARGDPEDAAAVAEIIRRIEEAARAARPRVRNPAALRAMRQSATAAALAYAIRERLTLPEVALLSVRRIAPQSTITGARSVSELPPSGKEAWSRARRRLCRT